MNSDPNEKRGSLLLAWQVRDKHCLVIGSGDVALSRIEHMIVAQAKITVITGETKVHPQILKLNEQGAIHKLIERNYQPSDLKMYENEGIDIEFDKVTEEDFTKINEYLHNNRFEVVCCCIDDHILSAKIYFQCKLLGINANIADKPELCDFYFGAMINKDNLQIMISTNGKSPRLLKIIKDIIKKQIDDIDLNKAIENLNLVRFNLRKLKLPENDVNTIDLRMQWIKKLTDFFDTKAWSEMDINDENVLNIVNKYPEYPPEEIEEFKRLLI